MKSLNENIVASNFSSQLKSTGQMGVLADETTGYFGENSFWLFRKTEEWKIRDAYKICQGKQIRSFRYLMGILKNV